MPHLLGAGHNKWFYVKARIIGTLHVKITNMHVNLWKAVVDVYVYSRRLQRVEIFTRATLASARGTCYGKMAGWMDVTRRYFV